MPGQQVRAIWNPERDLWETGEADLISGHWDVYSETLPIWGMTRNGELFEHRKPEPLTAGNGYSLLPTPLTTLATVNSPQTPEQNKARGYGNNLVDVVVGHLLPTPTASLAAAGQKARGGERGDELLLPGIVERVTAHIQAEGELLPTPDAYNHRRGGSTPPEKRRAGGHAVALQDVAEHKLLPTPMTGSTSPAAHGQISGDFRSGMETAFANWGEYLPAIQRWEDALGIPAPAPTTVSRYGNPQLAAPFVEWMMGLPPGWVTDPALGLSRPQQLTALGNGVVPQQAVFAIRLALEAIPGSPNYG